MRKAAHDDPCNKTKDDIVHRRYPCPHEGCTVKMWSIESRDIHEANVHGDGW